MKTTLQKQITSAETGLSNELIQNRERFGQPNSTHAAEVGGNARRRVCASVVNASEGIEYVF
jgi:hypothetical protein